MIFAGEKRHASGRAKSSCFVSKVVEVPPLSRQIVAVAIALSKYDDHDTVPLVVTDAKISTRPPQSVSPVSQPLFFEPAPLFQ